MEPKFIQVHSEVMRYLNELRDTQSQLQQQYREYIEKNRISKVFGLDSFYYQSRLYDLESKHLNDQYLFINNRIYCDYYKLYGMMKVFYKDSFKLEPRKRVYPVYKDLESFKPYDIEESMSLNVDVQEMIQKSYACVKKNEEDIQAQVSYAYNIDNYIHNHQYNNQLLKNKIELYEKYLRSYHIYHMSFLSHLRDKIMLLFHQTKNRVLMGSAESWEKEIILKEELNDYPIDPTKYEPVEVVIHKGSGESPKFVLPPLKLPTECVPTVPEVPVVTIPEVPAVTVPEVPAVPVPEVPAVPVPEVPALTLPEVPAVPVPEVPAVTDPILEINVPALTVPEVHVPVLEVNFQEVQAELPVQYILKVPVVPEVHPVESVEVQTETLKKKKRSKK